MEDTVAKEQGPVEMQPKREIVEEVEDNQENRAKLEDWVKEQMMGITTGKIKGFGVGLRGGSIVTRKEASGESPK